MSTTTGSATRTIGTHRLVAAGAFAVQGLLFIALTLRLPQLKAQLGLGELALAGLMLLLVLMAGAGSVVAGALARRRDSATAVRAALVLLAVGTALVGLATAGTGHLPVLVVAVTVYGLGVGANDAASNMQAVAVEQEMGRPVLPSFHAAWTAGGLVATLAVLALGGLTHPAAHVVLTALPLALLAAPFLRHDRGTVAEDPTSLGVPWRTVALVGLGLVLFYSVDTAVTAWGPVYLSSDAVFTNPPTSPDLYALATLPYLVATLLARSVGDAATARLGAPAVVRIGAVTAFVGLAVVVLAPASTWPVAIVGFFVVGLGVAVVAPLSFSAAARVAGSAGDEAARRRRVDATIARFNQFNYAGALLGSVLTGAIGTSTLRVGFALPMVLVLGLVPLARHFGGSGTEAAPAA
ncbi:MFS transporter [Oryzobacter telluris]|uniref:MFS transporter n=1 Tax=Oryzobacter telluris TaxID=3149179 RepID=UPI00370D2E71